MRVLILGGGGFLGSRLASELAARGRIGGKELTALCQADAIAPVPAAGSQGLSIDVAEAEPMRLLIGEGWDVVFHLAAVVSAQAEAEPESGLRVNLGGALNVLEACRATGTAPALVFASSVAVYGGDVPGPLGDVAPLLPQTSYGTQKAAAELLVADWSRRGFVDGRAVRIPTVTIRPGTPNRAASSFMSSIFREPLQGRPANRPVEEDYPVWWCSPRKAVENMILAAEVDAAELGGVRAFALPGRRDTIGEMIAAMTRVAGPGPATLIASEPEPEVRAVVRGWRADIRPELAPKLGMTPDDSFEDAVRAFMEDEGIG